MSGADQTQDPQQTLKAAQNPDRSAIQTTPTPSPSIAPQPTKNLDVPGHNSATWGDRVYHGVLDALGGADQVSYQRDPQSGKMIATATKSGPGQQWKRIVAGALSGYAAGAATGATGPGSTAAKIGAGYNAGFKLGQGRDQQARQQANEDFEAQQKAATSNAQNALLTHQIARSTFDLGRDQINAAAADTERENTFSQLIGQGGDASQDLGVFSSFDDVLKAFKQNPELHDHQAGGRIVAIPHINAQGKVDGVHAALVTPDWLSSKVNQDLPITVRSYKDGKLEESTFTIPSGTITGDQYVKMTMSQSADALKEWTDQQNQEREASRVRAENTASYASAAKDSAQIKALEQANDQDSINSNAEQIYNGSMDPSNLNKMSRSGKAGSAYNQTLARVNAISMADTGQPFDVAKAMGDYKYATQGSTYNTMNYLNSLTGRNNDGGNLGEVIKLSDNLKRSAFPPINNVEQWAKISAGDPNVAAYRAAIVEVSDQVAKILQGGGTGNATSDAKLNQAQEILNKNFSAGQMKQVANELRVLLANRKTGMIGTNRYMLRWYGPQQQGAPTQGAPTPGATPNAQPGAGKVISLADAKKLPQFAGKSDAEITAAAKGLGYTVQ